ncbi:DNA-methyltransferase [Labrys wisconsinensis]|uniref:Methyltransferase n=1 Tax=Labrys wisconsinensis TaxID=425677 RepID=A0ABU0JEU4_9HYPH|nr:site-specific DNA-methyltransferase [Labrys wisconsinensis]MDQ0472795.1 site-specific DNA-methyltransferase (adenine-specific) [Labrys wisconsinensis]
MSRIEQLGDGVTLYLADCLSVIPTLSLVDAVFADPPYSSGGQFRGDRMSRTTDKYQSSEHRGLYPEFSGDNRDQRAYAYWSALWLGACRQACRPGGLAGLFTDWRQLPTTTDALQSGGWVWRGIAVWDKTEAARPQKGRFRNQCEYLVWGSNGPLPVEGPCAPGVFRQAITSDSKEHVTAKPVNLMQQLLQLVPAGGIVLDPFMGSGTTGVAAVQSGLGFIGVEIEPTYFDRACRRIEDEIRRPRMFATAPPRAAQGAMEL